MRRLLQPCRRKKYTDLDQCIICGTTKELTRVPVTGHDAILCSNCRRVVLEQSEIHHITRSQVITKLLTITEEVTQ